MKPTAALLTVEEGGRLRVLTKVRNGAHATTEGGFVRPKEPGANLQ
jgi:hypothetical protein